jgi:putative glycosyltransferase (TIGR04372 family)
MTNSFLILFARLVSAWFWIRSLGFYIKKIFFAYFKFPNFQGRRYQKITFWGALVLAVEIIKRKIYTKLIKVKKIFFQIIEKINNKAMLYAYDWYESIINMNKYAADIAPYLGFGNESFEKTVLNIKICILNKEIEAAFLHFEMLVENHPQRRSDLNQIAVHAFLKAEYLLSEQMWTSIQLATKAQLMATGLDSIGYRFLAPSWILAIGHIAHLDTYFKNKILNGNKNKVYLQKPIGFEIPNKELFNKWVEKGYINSGTPANIGSLDEVEADLLTEEFWSQPVDETHSMMFSHAGSVVQRRWEAEGRGPLLSLNPIDKKEGAECLQRLGVPVGSWFVCLHVREQGFHQNWDKAHPSSRNANIDTYLPAAREIVKRGGFVIRMGDKSMKKLKPEQGIIDYPYSEYKSQFMDVFLCATAKFFIGTNSGLGLVPPIFGVPCALTNWMPIGIPQWYPKDIYIPKLIYSNQLKRHLTFNEMLLTNAGWIQFEASMSAQDLVAMPNTEEDILDVVVEMLERESGNSITNEALLIMQKTFEKIVEKSNSFVGARIGQQFLQKYEHLLD